jgi:hypothetical protein
MTMSTSNIILPTSGGWGAVGVKWYLVIFSDDPGFGPVDSGTNGM